MNKAILTLILLFALPLSRSHAQEAEHILEQAAERYRTLKEYQFTGTVSLEMEAAGQQQAMDISLMVAERRPTHLRAELESPAMQMRIVANDEATYMYLPTRNEYIRQEGPFDLQAGGSGVPDLLSEYQSLADGIEEAALLREEVVEQDDGSHPAYVISVYYQPKPTPSGPDSTSRTVWIDKERHLVLRIQTHTRRSTSPAGVPMVIREHAIFRETSVDQPLPDSLFAFDPPEGAAEVSAEEAFGGAERQRGFVGDAAIAFTLKNLSGEEVSLESLRGSVVLVNFWATWCGPCRMEMPAIERLYQQYAERGLVVLAVNLSEGADEVRAYIEKHGYTFPVLLDTDASVGDQYRTMAIPTSVIVNREGIVTSHFVGPRTEEVFLLALKEAGLDEAP